MTAPILLRHGDCLAVMREMDEASVDAIVTDPPYGLGFMGKAWDELPPGQPWAEECLRVLKPGGHLLAFGGTRTWHRLMVAVEDAGFEIRDSIAWLYGSGFPKSLDVSKAIDKAGGASPAVQAATLRTARERSGLTREQVAESVGCTPGSVRDWEDGRARATGRAVEFITPSEQYRATLAELLGYTADERTVVGIGGGPRGLYETGHRGIEYGTPATDDARTWQGWGTALKPAFEPIVVARKPLVGTVAANVLAHGTGALNIDGCRIEGVVPQVTQGAEDHIYGNGKGLRSEPTLSNPHVAGRWPANVILDESQAAELDEQSGTLTSGANPTRRGSDGDRTAYGDFAGQADANPQRGIDKGGASRFFYCAKAPTRERPKVDGIAHPTVKPLTLMRWLVRLVTPPDGLVLDTFAGSGTTGEACLLEGLRCMLIEREIEYFPLIAERIARVSSAAS